MKLRLKPSIPVRLEQANAGGWRATLIYDGGRKELVLDLDESGRDVIRALLNEGMPATDERLEALKDRRMLIGAEALTLIERRPMIQRQSLLLCDLAGDVVELEAALDRIESASIAIVGLGGIGSNMLDALLRMGFLNFSIIDMDRVAASNLNRQRIYTCDDVGELKVHAAATYARRVNERARVKAICTSVAGMAEGVLNDAIVINCADRPSIQQTSEELVAANPDMKALVLGGGYFCETSFAGPVLLRDEWGLIARIGEEPEDRGVHQSAVGGNTFSSAVLPASIAAWEVLRLVTGLGTLNLHRRMMIFDWRDFGIRFVELK